MCINILGEFIYYFKCKPGTFEEILNLSYPLHLLQLFLVHLVPCLPAPNLPHPSYQVRVVEVSGGVFPPDDAAPGQQAPAHVALVARLSDGLLYLVYLILTPTER